MEVSMSKTRRGKYTDNRICYISKCKGDMRLYLRRKGKLSCFSYLVRGKSFSFYRGKIRIKQELSYKSRFIRYKKSFMQHLLQCMNDSFPHISLEATRLYFPHQPFQRIDSLDTIIICRRVFIERQDILGILVLDLLKRSEFALQGLLIPYRCSYLIIG